MSSEAKDRVVENYVAQKPNRNQDGRVAWTYSSSGSAYGYSGRQLYCEGEVLYSYGPHFPLAAVVGIEKAGTKNERCLFVKNGDKHSSTTTSHQSMVQSACEGPTVSLSALAAAGIEFKELVLKPTKTNRITQPERKKGVPVILFWRPDKREYVWRHEDGHYTTAHDYPPKKFKPPKQGMFVASSRQKEDGKTYGYWHVLGAVVIEYENNYYLCGLDDGTYFVAQLRGKPRNCDHAYEMLKPREVREAEAEGKRVFRQGEWFFVPTGMKDQDLRELLLWTQKKLEEQSNIEALPVQRTGPSGSNLHVCKQLKLQGGKRIYVKGKVFHRFPFNGNPLTNQHPTVNLGDEWHIAYHNTEVQSWSMDGSFD